MRRAEHLMSDDAAQRVRVSVGDHAGQQLVVLSDLEAETQAQLVPGLGFACIAFRVMVGDEAWAVLAEPPDEQALLNRTTRYGIPILFPWPNRVRGGLFT